MDIRNFLFSNRSFTPIPIALAVIYFSEPKFPFFIFGLFLVILGELIRMNAVRYAGGVTRTMNVGAPSLCTSGPYSYTRNPLYLGNMIIYLGISIVSGGNYMNEMCALVFLFFTFQYSMIISLEEETLQKLFGDEYAFYCKKVPRLFPRVRPWNENSKHNPSTFSKTIKTEKRTLQNIFFIFLLIVIKTFF
jgi:protein-S-isoprenylcysteine O-methyltransferase Ste14